jgi:hypothetical protein
MGGMGKRAALHREDSMRRNDRALPGSSREDHDAYCYVCGIAEGCLGRYECVLVGKRPGGGRRKPPPGLSAISKGALQKETVTLP